MNLPTFVTKNLHVVERLVQNNSSSILTAVGVVGVVGTAVLTNKAATKATRILDQERFDRSQNSGAPTSSHLISRRDKIKFTYKAYLPALAVGSLTIAAIVGAQYVNTKRMAVLTASYVALESKHEEYKDKVKELFGEKKSVGVDESIYKDMATRGMAGGVEILAGDVPCLDVLSGRIFSSNMESLRKAANDINERIVHGDQPSVSDLYSYLNIPHNKLSDAFGWNDENMCEMKFTTVLDANNTPVLVMDFSVLPIGTFWKVGK